MKQRTYIGCQHTYKVNSCGIPVVLSKNFRECAISDSTHEVFPIYFCTGKYHALFSIIHTNARLWCITCSNAGPGEAKK